MNRTGMLLAIVGAILSPSPAFADSGISETYPADGLIEISDTPFLDRTKAKIKTKITSQERLTFSLYYLKNGAPSPYQSNYADTAETVPLTVILKLSDDRCSRKNETFLSYDDSDYHKPVVAIFNPGMQDTHAGIDALDNFDLRNIAMRRARIIMKYIDINEMLYTSGESCDSPTLSYSIRGLPECIANGSNTHEFDSEKYLRVFGSEAYQRCVVENGQPCSSAHHGAGNIPFSNAYGCYECTLGKIGYCSNDNFAIRPAAFDVNISNGYAFSAGKGYNLSFKALTAKSGETAINYNEIQSTAKQKSTFLLDMNVTNSTHCQIKSLTLKPLVHFVDGLHKDSFNFDDIGIISFSLHESNGSEFALIDANDTLQQVERLIQEKRISFRVLPDHFSINADLDDHNTKAHFTYLNNIHTPYSRSMSALLRLNIKALGANGHITHNYTSLCYAKDTNLTLDLNHTIITYTGPKPALTQFLYFNPLEHNTSIANSGEGNYSLTAFTNYSDHIITLTALPIHNTEASFPINAPDGNGTTTINYRLNFDRNLTLTVNPFSMRIIDINISDPDGIEEKDPVYFTNNTSTFYYARAKASKHIYEDITEDSVHTPISIVIFNDPSTSATDLNLTHFRPTEEYDWYLSTSHNTNSGDGNISLIASSSPAGSTVTDQLNITAGGVDTNIIVNANDSHRPLDVNISFDTTNPTDTSHWIIYNPDNNSIPAPFYRVRFVGESNWAGYGKMGNVVNGNSNKKKNRRLEW